MKNIIYSLFLLSAISLTGCGGGGSSGGNGGGGTQSLPFTLAELNDHFLISADSLTYADDAMIARFDKDKQLRWIDGDLTPLSSYSKHDWAVVDGKLEIMFTNADGTPSKCTGTKTAENDASISASVSCEGGDGQSDSREFLKPQPFSASDLSGKEITVTGVGGPAFILTFNTDGTYDTNDGDTGLGYGDHPRYTNTVGLSFDSETSESAAFLLAEGTITNGTLVVIKYDEFDNFNGVDIIGTSGNTWTLLHGSD